MLRTSELLSELESPLNGWFVDSENLTVRVIPGEYMPPVLAFPAAVNPVINGPASTPKSPESTGVEAVDIAEQVRRFV